jgi:hypothetical protein
MRRISDGTPGMATMICDLLICDSLIRRFADSLIRRFADSPIRRFAHSLIR